MQEEMIYPYFFVASLNLGLSLGPYFYAWMISLRLNDKDKWSRATYSVCSTNSLSIEINIDGHQISVGWLRSLDKQRPALKENMKAITTLVCLIVFGLANSASLKVQMLYRIVISNCIFINVHIFFLTFKGESGEVNRVDPSANQAVEDNVLINLFPFLPKQQVGCIPPHYSCNYDDQEACCSGRCYHKEYSFFCA